MRTIRPGDVTSARASDRAGDDPGDVHGVRDHASLDDRRREVGELFERLGDAFRELRCVGSQRLLKAGVSMTHLHVLTMLRHHGPMPMHRVAEILDASLSNASGIVDRLEERGLVERVRVPDDRRVVMVHLTDAADTVLEDVDVLRSDLIAAVLTRLDGDQLERLAGTIADLTAALGAELASAPGRYPGLDPDGTHAHLHTPAGFVRSAARTR